MLANRRVKIVATIGPASKEKENLKHLIEAGVNIVRLNFSHGTHEEHAKVIQYVRELSQELQASVGILQDLQGPKIRLGKMTNGAVEIKDGQKLQITTENILGTNTRIPTDLKSLPMDCKVGQKILIDDGLIELKVLSTDKKANVECEVIYGGIVKDRKGLNIPGAQLKVDCLTEKDLADLQFGLEQKVDYIALSFVRQPEDMKRLRSLSVPVNPNVRLVAKIEMLEAIENLTAIIEESDAVMVARGDLAVEVGQAFLPGLQKKIIKESNRLHKPVITATQMLDSMVVNPRPTRAEVSDVANAILDGSDALMLSAESASGKYPRKCVETMHEIACEVENKSTIYYKYRSKEKYSASSDAIAESACLVAQKLEAKAIICLTTTGKTATMISSFRPDVPIIGVSHLDHTSGRLELVWGIHTFQIEPYATSQEAMDKVEQMLLKYGLVQAGDRVVLTLGYPVMERAKTNSLRIHRISESKEESIDSKIPLRFKTN